ncbi:sulfate adenylyltransferase subunit 1 [Eisenibacter elegans]|jgi:sulfate adenylyltransferase subunit 1|uniref:sulfate adenylyltransferase subunit 1 n=1 Tax=Eisenibacter elegans TaxID=997 RepID=UPI0004129264|nr:GTP-binding protein [Eisenibacter elegans]
MDILRFFTAGSVDDGKSTLIGRLLYDSRAIPLDLLEAIERASKNKNDGEIDLALLTDGLRDERAQGITIDVAYKYFQTERRKFIIADTPGHVQYTRNMVTGASNCQLAVILVDAREGVTEQTKRHTYLCHLLGIKHMVIAINKMDLVDYAESRFEEIIADYEAFAAPLAIANLAFIPVSALKGDNIVHPSARMPWYKGLALLPFLEEVSIVEVLSTQPRFQVQYVIRPQTDALHDYRGYAGRINSGTYKAGQEVVILPSGLRTTLAAIEFDGQQLPEASAPMSVVLHLAEDVDVSRGDMIVPATEAPTLSRELRASLCWMENQPLNLSKKYLLQHNSRLIRCAVKEVSQKTDIHTLEAVLGDNTLLLNDIGQVVIRLAAPIAADTYSQNRENGAFILIDEQHNNTVAAGMITAVEI